MRKKIDVVFFRQQRILKQNLLVETLGQPTLSPKGEHVFELKPLPDTLKYAYLDENKIYPVIIHSNLSVYEEERLLFVLRNHRAAIVYTLDDLKCNSLTLCTRKFIWN